MFGVGLGFVRRAGRRVARSCVDLFLGPDRAELRRLVRQGRVVMGIGSYGIPKVRVFTHEDSVRLVVGNYCSIAEEALFLLGGEHPTDRLSTFPFRLRFGLEGRGDDGFPKPVGDTVLGSDVWVGARAIILGGRRIGTGAVIAACSVVTRDVPPYAIVAGNPGRVVRYRFSEELRKQLLATTWWEWPEDEVASVIPLLSADDVSGLLHYAANRQG